MEFNETMNSRNINAAGKPETIRTARRLAQAVDALRERRAQARQRFLDLEARFRTMSNSNVSYVSINGISMPMPR